MNLSLDKFGANLYVGDMFKLTIQEKIDSTVKSVLRYIAAGWEKEAALVNQRHLWHLSNKSMKIVRERVEIELNKQ